MNRVPKIRLSPSSLSAWWTSGCPAKWKYERGFESADPKDSEALQRGISVHSLLEGKSLSAEPDKITATMYQKLRDLVAASGFRILASELTQKFRLPIDGINIEFTRRVDAIVQLPDTRIAVVDWKTTGGMGWKTAIMEEAVVAPQALAFQTPGYLIRDPSKRLSDYGIGTELIWPDYIVYCVVGFKGAPQMFYRQRSEEDEQRFLWLAEMAARSIYMCETNDNYPKNFGRGCLDCKMRPMCFNEPNWPTKVKEKERFDGSEPT